MLNVSGGVPRQPANALSGERRASTSARTMSVVQFASPKKVALRPSGSGSKTYAATRRTASSAAAASTRRRARGCARASRRSIAVILVRRFCELTLADDRAQAGDETADPLGDRGLLQGAVGDAEVAAVGDAERRSGNHGDLVLANQALGDSHRVDFAIHLQQHVKGAVGGRHFSERCERFELVQ